MKKLFLHAGTGKAGSTAIQSCIHENRDVLASRNLNTLPVLSDTRPGKFFARPGCSDEFLYRIREQLETHTTEHRSDILISSESFWTAGRDDLVKFIDIFDSFSASIFIYVRPQPEYLQSIFLQLIKTRKIYNCVSPEVVRGILLGNEGSGSLLKQYFSNRYENLDYVALNQKFKSIDRVHSVSMIPFNRESFANGDIVSDFFPRVFGSSIDLKVSLRSNPSMCIESCYLWNELSIDPGQRTCLQSCQIDSTNRKQYKQVLLSLKGRKWFLPFEEVTNIKDDFEVSNRVLFNADATFSGFGSAASWGDVRLSLDDIKKQESLFLEQVKASRSS